MSSSEEVAACLPAGRYEFKDAGIYIGEWLNERAVGLGLITKDKCQGEYTGLWDQGSEKSGVFLWPNAPGAMYEGEWAANRRNGYGIFYREDWVVMGLFKDDFIALGQKSKEGSIGRFEGEFENGFPSFGVETYADGGNYAGEYKNGIRQGLGVRRSIPYGEVINFFPEEAALAAELARQKILSDDGQGVDGSGLRTRRGSSVSQRSGDAVELHEPPEDEDDEPYGISSRAASSRKHGPPPLRLSSKYKCGFVLSSQRSDLLLKRQAKLDSRAAARAESGGTLLSFGGGGGGGHPYRARARSLSNIFNPHAKESPFRRTGSTCGRSLHSTSERTHFNLNTESIFNLDQVEAIDPETVETYAGQWDGDARHGYGICVRSDGVSYEGQWSRNQRHGYGQTKFRDGTVELGRYQHGRLIFLAWTKGAKPHMLLYNYHITREVAAAVKKATAFADAARDKGKLAQNKLHQVKDATEKAGKSAQFARDYSLETRELVQEMYPDFEQPGVRYLDDMVRLMQTTKHGNRAFENALQSAQDVLAGITSTLMAGASGELKKKREQVSNVSPEVGLELPPKIFMQDTKKVGKHVSRAGSYRKTRQARKKQAEAQKAAAALAAAAAANSDRGSQATLADDAQPMLNGLTTPMNGSGHTPPVPNLLSVPKIPLPNGNGPVNSSDDEDEDDEDATSQISSSSSSYLFLPKVDQLKPQSDIPKIPLAKLFNNPTLFTDHFDQYAGAVYEPIETRYDTWHALYGHEAGHRRHRRVDSVEFAAAQLINPVPLHLCGVAELIDPEDDAYSQMNGELLDSQLDLMSIPGLSVTAASGRLVSPAEFAAKTNSLRPGHIRRNWEARRRTLPTLMTQAPVVDVPRVPSQAAKRSPARFSPYDYQGPAWKEREGTPGITHLPHGDGPKQMKDVYHIIEDGVRKRLYKTSVPVEHLMRDDRPNADPDQQDRPIIIPTASDCVEVRSHVIISSPQDELPILPVSFSESRNDISQCFNEMSSMPDVRVCGELPEEVGIAPTELIALNKLSQKKRAEEEARRNEGEIVISLTDLFDWLKVNCYWISVLLFNVILAYAFMKILKKPIRKK